MDSALQMSYLVGYFAERMKRIPSLDGLRAISILAVVVGHLCGTSGRAAAVIVAGLGVHVFFVVSGYLITRLLQDEYSTNGEISLVGFYRRRCFRILPAAFAYIVTIGLFVSGSRPGLPYAATYTVSYFFLATPEILRHLWSLSIEEQFYLLWPLALVLGFRYRGKIALGAIAAAAVYRAAMALCHPQGVHYDVAVHFVFPGAIDSIAMGCLLAIYESRIRERLTWLVDCTAVVIALPVVAFTLYSALWGNSDSLLGRVVPIFWPVFPAALALWIFLLVERRDWLFNNLVAVGIGVLSYSLYLWQQPFTAAGMRFHPLQAVTLLTACSIASYFVVERPMLRLGRRTRPPAHYAKSLPLWAEGRDSAQSPSNMSILAIIGRGKQVGSD